MKNPGHSALLTDIDGTLSRIVYRPDLAKVPAGQRDSLQTLSGQARPGGLRHRPSGPDRQSKMVGADNVIYFGNHGLELLEPGRDEPTPDARWRAADDGQGIHPASTTTPVWVEAQIRVEDKGAIQALHWRGAGHRTESKVRVIGDNARGAGLVTHWGRKVMELRPPDMAGKAGAVEGLIKGTESTTWSSRVTTRPTSKRCCNLRRQAEDGDLKKVIIVAVDSDEVRAMLLEDRRHRGRRPGLVDRHGRGLAQQAG